MNLSHLYYFRKLAQVQHYTRAAKELFIAQPTLSAAISQLEKELGAPLFQKHTRSVRLTAYGEDFYRYVDVALQNLDKGIDVVQQRAGMRQSSVRVGTVGVVQDKVWSRGIRAFRDSMDKDVLVEIRRASTSKLSNGLKQGSFDVVFTDVPIDEPGIVCLPYRTFDLVLLVNKLHVLASKTTVTLEDVSTFPLISYDAHHENGKTLNEIFEQQGISVAIPCNDPSTMCSLVSVDVTYAAIAVGSFMTSSFEGVATVPISDIPRGVVSTYICCHDEQSAPEVVKRFVDMFTRRHAPAPSLSMSGLTAEAAAAFNS